MYSQKIVTNKSELFYFTAVRIPSLEQATRSKNAHKADQYLSIPALDLCVCWTRKFCPATDCAPPVATTIHTMHGRTPCGVQEPSCPFIFPFPFCAMHVMQKLLEGSIRCSTWPRTHVRVAGRFRAACAVLCMHGAPRDTSGANMNRW